MNRLLLLVLVVPTLAGCSSAAAPTPADVQMQTPTPSPTPTFLLYELPASLGFEEGKEVPIDGELSVWPHLVDTPGWTHRDSGGGDLTFVHDDDGCEAVFGFRDTTGLNHEGAKDKRGTRSFLRAQYSLNVAFASRTIRVAHSAGGTISMTGVELHGTSDHTRNMSRYVVARSFGTRGETAFIQVTCDGPTAESLFNADVKPKVVYQFGHTVEPTP
jgi:hypothetical protein